MDQTVQFSNMFDEATNTCSSQTNVSWEAEIDKRNRKVT